MQCRFAVLGSASYYIIYGCLCLGMALGPNTGYAQGDMVPALSTSEEVNTLSASDLLDRAERSRREDPIESLNLAKKALDLSKTNKNLRDKARALMLLAELSVQSRDIARSRVYFAQALEVYEQIGNKREKISSSIEYVEWLFGVYAYDEGFEITKEVLPAALEYGEDKLIARLLRNKGDAHLTDKSYAESININTQALAYLSATDKETLRNRGLTYHQIAQGYKKLKEYKQTAAFHKRALDDFKAIADERLTARAYKNISMAEHKQENLLVALDYLLKSIELHDRLDQPKELAELLMMAGIIYRELDRFEKALENTNKAYLIAKELNETPRIAETSNQMGHLYTRLNKPDQARFFYQVTTNLPEDSIAAKTIASASREIAVIDSKSGKYEFALRMGLKAHNIYKKINEKSKGSATARIVAKIYKELDNEAKALEYFRESLALANEVGKKKDRIKSLNNLGRALVDADADEAIALLREALKLAGDSYNDSDKISTYNALRKAEKNRGNYLEALEFAEEQISLSDQIYKAREKRNVAKIKARLDSHKLEIELESLRRKAKLDELEISNKDNQIKLANQTNQISELELTKNRYASILLAVLLAICFAAAIFIYRSFVVSKKRNKELDYLAGRDPLTNCFNRRVLFERMNQDFENLEQFNEYSVILADVDHFKQVNDTYGHNTGDTLLREFANILQDSVRQSDVIARYGGEEFCIVLPNTSQRHALRIAEVIRKKIEESEFDKVKVTCSFGVSSIRFGSGTPTELIEQSDVALYASKANGRNQVTLWDPSI